MQPSRIILASSSSYRRAALSRLGLAFECVSPAVDETPLPNESPAALAQRLSLAKARVVAAKASADNIVIGADQTGELAGTVIGKPGTAAMAREQLARSSGQEVMFHSAMAVCRGAETIESVTLTRVRMRHLDDATIARYVTRDQPLDCAGSFKCEALGIALFTRCESEDPTALFGLPLIALTDALTQFGVEII